MNFLYKIYRMQSEQKKGMKNHLPIRLVDAIETLETYERLK